MGKASKQTLIRLELEKIKNADPRKRLRPEAVVAYARTHPKSALHGEFEWDASKAAEQAWLERARQIIKVTVVVHRNPASRTTVVTPEYVSLPSMRGDGYMPVVEVLARRESREDLLLYCLNRFKQVREAWLYPELAAITNEVDKLMKLYAPNDAAPPPRHYESEAPNMGRS
jgi:hypothetical protein